MRQKELESLPLRLWVQDLGQPPGVSGGAKGTTNFALFMLPCHGDIRSWAKAHTFFYFWHNYHDLILTVLFRLAGQVCASYFPIHLTTAKNTDSYSKQTRMKLPARSQKPVSLDSSLNDQKQGLWPVSAHD